MSFRMVVVPVTHDVRQHAASEQRRAELQRILDVRVLRIEVNDSPVDTGHVVFAHIDLHGQYSIDCDILDRSTRTVHRTLSRTLSVFDFFSKKVIHRVLLDYIRCIGYTIYIINNIHTGMNIINHATRNEKVRRFMEQIHQERQGDLRKNKYVEQLKVDAIITMQDKQLLNLPF